jgi:putative membrane protein insertion efficiency factor
MNMQIVDGQEDEKDHDDGEYDGDLSEGDEDSVDVKSEVKEVLVNAVKWYRSVLSPIMPPNCRFVPSCSNYSIEALQTFGSVKGLILTAWRILRCNPLGGAGYDPPMWPPPGFRAGTNTKNWF